MTQGVRKMRELAILGELLDYGTDWGFHQALSRPNNHSCLQKY